MQRTKRLVEKVSLIATLLRKITSPLTKMVFRGSQKYWESRYAAGGTSGAGSYGRLAEFKAQIVNSFVRDYKISSVIEFGCGDGNQISLANYPAYIGLDVSKTAIKLCKERFGNDVTKSFFLYEPDCFVDGYLVFKAELALSLDVIYHLVEDGTFHLYMNHLFSAANKFVIIYSTDTNINRLFQKPHVRHRNFSEWVKKNLPEWKLLRKIPNECSLEIDNQTQLCADFFIYERA
jgi:SAM-dependent methyltransferase